jgi:hypothetical protein
MPPKRHAKTKHKSKGQSGNSHLLALVDRAKALSDGTVVSLQDSQEMKRPAIAAPSRIPRSFERRTLWIKSSYTGSFSTSSSLPVFGALDFQLSSVNNYTSYAAIFDQYCIAAAVIRFETQVNSVPAGSVVGSLITVIDHDDANALSTIAAALEYSTALESPSYLGQTRLVYPRFAVGAYTGSFGGFGNLTGYIDCASTTVQHYGLKYNHTVAANTQTITYYVDLFIHFRDFH